MGGKKAISKLLLFFVDSFQNRYIKCLLALIAIIGFLFMISDRISNKKHDDGHVSKTEETEIVTRSVQNALENYGISPPKAYPEIERSLRKSSSQINQAIDDKLRAADSLLNSARYKDAENYYDDLLGIFPDVANLHFNLGYSYYKQFRLREAEDEYRKASILDPRDIKAINNLAGMLQEQGLFSKAEPIYKHALELCTDTLYATSLLYGGLLSNLGNVYLMEGKYKEAKARLDEAYAYLQQIHGTESAEFMYCLSNMAGYYIYHGSYFAAETLLVKIMELAPTAAYISFPLIADVTSNLAGVYMNTERILKADSLFLASARFVDKFVDKSSMSYSLYINNWGYLLVSKGDYATADSLFEISYAIVRNVVGLDHPGFVVALNNLALTSKMLRRYSKAEELYKQALTIGTRLFGAINSNIAASAGNLAGMYKEQGRLAESEPLFLKAIASFDDKGKDPLIFKIGLLHSLAHVYQLQKRYEKAEVYYLQAVGLGEKVLGANHQHFADCLNSLGGLYVLQKRYGDAVNTCNRALAIYEAMSKIPREETITALVNLGGAYTALGNNKEAQECARRIRELADNSP